MAGKKSNKITYTKRGRMLTGKKASLYSAVTAPFRAVSNAIEGKRAAHSAKRIGRKHR